jgi:hypothetical protein
MTTGALYAKISATGDSSFIPGVQTSALRALHMRGSMADD